MASSVSVPFCAAAQDLEPLQAAAYRLIGTGTCEISRTGDQWCCVLTPNSHSAGAKPIDLEALRIQFLNFVTDENLRARVSRKTEGVRNVILALAFGSLVSER